VSYQINSFIAVGVGFDAKDITTRSAAIQIPFRGPIFNVLQNADGWGYGWDAGITVKPTKTTIASLAFFSQINNNLTGPSTYGTLNTLASSVNIQPMALVLRITQFLNKNWFVRATGSWSGDSAIPSLVFNNTPFGRVTIPLHEKDSYLLALMTHYQFNQRWGFLLGGVYVTQVISPADMRPIAPDGDQEVLFGGPSLKLSKIVSAQFIYAHVWYNTRYNYLSTIRGAAGPVFGSSVSNRNSYELRLSFKI
jgi:long-chain fatty acid transport protein